MHTQNAEDTSNDAPVSAFETKTAVLIPHKKGNRFGFVNSEGKLVVPAVYSNVGFYTEDCNLTNSPNAAVRKFGSGAYASVRYGNDDFRIDMAGNRVYRYKKADLGRCVSAYIPQQFQAYRMGNYYGIIHPETFTDATDYRQFTIYPQYDYLHILESEDRSNPMIVAARGDKFGIIDVTNKIIIAFEYTDIKRNFSWKLARLFEVTRDGTNYFFIDANGRSY